MDRYYYSIEENEAKNKVVHLFGNIYICDVDETETNYRIAEWTGCYLRLPVIRNLLDNGCFYETINECVDYLGDLSKQEAIETCKTYFDGNPGTELRIEDVNKDTPCGCYWFKGEFDDEA